MSNVSKSCSHTKQSGLPAGETAACGLCGKSKNLARTECCGRWICNDEHKYVIFSYARNSCSRNHSRFTLCGSHHSEDHAGLWQECVKCRQNFETEMYVYYGTNEYNFETLPNPPAFEPTRCSQCGDVIVMSEGGFSSLGNEYFCGICSETRLAKLLGASADSAKPETETTPRKPSPNRSRPPRDAARRRKLRR